MKSDSNNAMASTFPLSVWSTVSRANHFQVAAHPGCSGFRGASAVDGAECHPQVNSPSYVIPDCATPGGAAVTLTVNGTRFVHGRGHQV